MTTTKTPVKTPEQQMLEIVNHHLPTMLYNGRNWQATNKLSVDVSRIADALEKIADELVKLNEPEY